MKPVTDEALLSQLNAQDRKPVTDPALLKELEGEQESQERFSFVKMLADSPTGKMVQGGLHAFFGTPEAKGTARSYAEGATLGWGDEAGLGLAAAAASTATGDDFGDVYGQMRNLYDREQGAFRESNPGLSLGMEMAGGGATGGGLVKQMADPRAAVRLAKTVVGGAGVGATAGAGFADEEDKLEGAIVGALSGGAVAGMIPLAGAGWNQLAGAWRRYAPKQGEEFARTKLRKILESSGAKNADDVIAKLDAMGAKATLADVDDGLRLQAERAAQRPGEAHRLSQFYADRGKESGRRVAQDIDDLFSGRVKLSDFVDDVVARSEKEAGPLYKSAMAQPVEMTDELLDILNTPAAKTALRKAQTIAQNDGVALAADAPDMRTLDYLKKGLDEVIDRSGTTAMGKQTPVGRSVAGIKRRLLAEVDAQNPTYKEARGVYAGLAETKKAAEEGAKFWNKTDQQISSMLKSMSQSERDAFRHGAMQKLYDESKKVTDAGSAYKRLFGDAAKRDKIKAVLQDDEAFTRFEQALLREQEFNSTLQATRLGSQTARRMQPEGGIDVPIATSIRDFALQGARNLAGRVPAQSQSATSSMAQLLMRPGDDAQEAARLIFREVPNDAKREALIRMLQGGGAAVSAIGLQR